MSLCPPSPAANELDMTSEESKTPADLYRSLSKGKVAERSRGRHATASMDMRTIASFLSEMKVTKPEVLRATPAHKALQGCGRALRSSPDPLRLFALSQEVEEINEFWSHSWHDDCWKKILLLLVLKNGQAAICVGTVAASILMALFIPGLLPAKSPFGSESTSSYWSVLAGILASSATLLFWKTKKMVFLDRVCVNQVDEDLKCEAILSIGALLKSSEAMLVLWDTTYVERLWCVFELAAFIKSHEEMPPNIKPTLLGPCTCSIALGTTMFVLLLLLVPFDNLVLGCTALLTLGSVGFYSSAAGFRDFYRSVETTQEQIRNFRVQGAKCACCDIGHTGEGAVMLCDRRIVLSCIDNWYGSDEIFEASVQSVVRDTLARQLGQDAFPYSWFIGASVPVLWGAMDVVATRLRDHKNQEAVYYAIVWLAWWLFAFPLLFFCWSKIAYMLRRSGSGCHNVLMNLLGASAWMAMLSAVYFVQWACTSLLDEVYGAVAFTAIGMATSLLVHWPRLICRATRQSDKGATAASDEAEKQPADLAASPDVIVTHVHVSV